MNPKAIPANIISWKKGIVDVYWIDAATSSKSKRKKWMISN